uniref:Uncharacterized protein n=1 Tax=Chromera velia CCMP2878 TaxID=1169474 RepID=A0A0G4GG42_9ALVE|eukprot:Cvel_21750.t1-p1 / transcript=Cvel_21750.t1 / gene=Cvel_21750 / organism=Chromera_velia_CCMP2878 / gene_product=Probable cytosolic iron-sulfur protein assembly, putative / transcript_product=Probable cytosolic iron-sulfur protein assembly, putative / location=Cvel_scaffold2067:22245-27872(-) / protein_length=883 / sequence_SO=supercontig / SO=protein_coding / is_pseudo=false
MKEGQRTIFDFFAKKAPVRLGGTAGQQQKDNSQTGDPVEGNENVNPDQTVTDSKEAPPAKRKKTKGQPAESKGKGCVPLTSFFPQLKPAVASTNTGKENETAKHSSSTACTDTSSSPSPATTADDFSSFAAPSSSSSSSSSSSASSTAASSKSSHTTVKENAKEKEKKGETANKKNDTGTVSTEETKGRKTAKKKAQTQPEKEKEKHEKGTRQRTQKEQKGENEGGNGGGEEKEKDEQRPSKRRKKASPSDSDKAKENEEGQDKENALREANVVIRRSDRLAAAPPRSRIIFAAEDDEGEDEEEEEEEEEAAVEGRSCHRTGAGRLGAAPGGRARGVRPPGGGGGGLTSSSYSSHQRSLVPRPLMTLRSRLLPPNLSLSLSGRGPSSSSSRLRLPLEPSTGAVRAEAFHSAGILPCGTVTGRGRQPLSLAPLVGSCLAVAGLDSYTARTVGGGRWYLNAGRLGKVTVLEYPLDDAGVLENAHDLWGVSEFAQESGDEFSGGAGSLRGTFDAHGAWVSDIGFFVGEENVCEERERAIFEAAWKEGRSQTAALPLLVTSSADCTLKAWSWSEVSNALASSEEEVSPTPKSVVFNAHESGIYGLDVQKVGQNGGGGLVASAGKDGKTRVWGVTPSGLRPTPLLQTQNPDCHRASCKSVRWHPKIPWLLASCGNDKEIRFWDVRAPAPKGATSTSAGAPPRGPLPRIDSQQGGTERLQPAALLTPGSEGEGGIDAEGGEEDERVSVISHVQCVNHVVFGVNGTVLMSFGNDQEIRVTDIRAPMRTVYVLSKHLPPRTASKGSFPPTPVFARGDASIVAFAPHSQSLYVYNTASGELEGREEDVGRCRHLSWGGLLGTRRGGERGGLFLDLQSPNRVDLRSFEWGRAV